MAPLVVVPRLSIAKQLQSYCAGRAFGAGIGLMVGQLVQIKRAVAGLYKPCEGWTVQLAPTLKRNCIQKMQK
ncbi:hypothetical protein [Thalassovita sp.]|jgi:glucokinase|uniref:hypothetical protein n=1 Tax=Thalassovita sp. TaxID=1979401 RepID=UPI0028823B0A|nr:hypothetical protein [Thalassovita sp.]MDF1803039.1 hypothetical protein [Thalassovita sp.]